ncbi:MAG TPA: hypothetical protein DCL38_10590 [Lachnospiraceae bacterium]|nr:hypothetical protein [Lachnospiraceae bacterium]
MSSGKKTIIIRMCLVLLLLVIAVICFITGRGHTVYFDNKAVDFSGETYPAVYKIEVKVNGEKAAKLYEDERGMADTMGQSFSMVVEMTKEKGDEPTAHAVSLSLPYSMDGIILNIPAMMAGLPPEAYLSEFVQAPEPEAEESEEVVTDEFVMEDL